MRRGRVALAAAALAALSGCAHWAGARGPVAASHSPAGRPAESYYCYDCHGYRYLDPYYDWCAGHGFRYAWDRHPETVRVYRERYVRLKEENPSFGRYRYPAGYRDSRRYREPRDYDSWRQGPSSGKARGPADLKVREKTRREPGSRKSNPKLEGDRGRPPAVKPAGGSWSGNPGGA